MAASTDINPAVLATALTDQAPVVEPVKTEEAPVLEKSEDKPDFSDLVERLTKGDFGNTASAHNGNELDKSSPMGDAQGFSAGVKDAAESQRDVDGAEKRVRNSVERSRATATPAPPANLNKGDGDEDENIIKSEDQIDEENIYSDLVDGEGAEGYVPVAEASEAIQYMTDTFAKAFTHLSAQVAALATETHGRMDSIEKSQALLREASVALLKSREEPIKKSMLTSTPVAVPSSGVVVIAPKPEEEKKDAPTTGVLLKSITKAMNKGEISPELGDRLLRTLDSRGAARVWEILTPEQREQISTAAN